MRGSRTRFLIGIGTRDRQASLIDLCRVIAWSFLCVLVTRTRADPDLWGHLRFGLDIVATRSLHLFDPYSFTSDRPWVNHEWLAEWLMGVAYTASGSTGLIVLKLAAIGVVATVLWAVAHEERARPLARDLFVVLALFATYSRTQVVRPQMFSVAIFCVILYLLRAAGRGRCNALWGLPLCFGIWANLHGGWIVGLVVLCVWTAGQALQLGTRDSGLGTRGSRLGIFFLGLILAASFAATLVNPYGVGLWQFLGETVRLERSDVSDWKPLLALGPGVLLIESILPLIALAAIWKGRARREWTARDAAVVLVLLAATFRVGRVDAFLQSAIAILLAGPLIDLFHRAELRLRRSSGRRSLAVSVLALVVGVYGLAVGISHVRDIRVTGHWIPDQRAALLLRETSPGARVLTWFDWGEYAIWQLSGAGIRVSMDGRRETVYSAQVIRDHYRFYEGEQDMVTYPERIGADHVWLPAHFRIIEPLTRCGWTKIIDTGRSVVLARHGRSIAGPSNVSETANVFPWP